MRKLGIAFCVLLLIVTGCTKLSLIKKANHCFQKQQAYVSVYYISKYNTITYQVVSPKYCALLVYHVATYADGFNPQMVGVQIQNFTTGQERNILITPSNARLVVDQLPPGALQRVKEYFGIKHSKVSRFDGRFITVVPAKLKVNQIRKAAAPVVEGELLDLQQEPNLLRLLDTPKSYFKIVLDNESHLPVNEYYWSDRGSIVRYLIFPKEIAAEIRSLEKLRSLREVQQLFEAKKIFDHIQLHKSEI